MAGKPPSFVNMKGPAGYVAGLGRGATGFTTRSDIGNAAPAPMGAQATLGDAASGSRAAMARGFGRGRGAPAPADDTPDPPNQFDEFQGGDAGIFAKKGAEYDDDDLEADAIWQSVDDHLDERRKDDRESRLKADLEQYRKDNPKITEQFADAKRKLSQVSYEEWDAIPDIGDYTIKKKKGGREFAPAPDTLLQKAMAEREKNAYDDGGMVGSGMDVDGAGGSGSGATTTARDLTAVGEGRGTVLGLKLDSMGDSVTGQTMVDPKGYLTGLQSQKISSTAEISDIKKARLLLKSVINTNPKHAPGWIAAARLEELAGKISAARSFAQKGCDACPMNPDVWSENARLNTPEDAKAILARAVTHMPTNVDLWMHATQLEDADDRKRRVLRKALEKVPNSVRLWKALVELSSEEDAKVLLSRATECCPQHVDLWLALARLETKGNARVVLNKARETLPHEPLVWIAAAKLEEANEKNDASNKNSSNTPSVGKIIERAIKSLKNKGVTIDREYWLKEAEVAEKAGSPKTCFEIVRVTIGIDVEDADKKRTWKADAAECMGRQSYETARAIYKVATDTFPGKKSAWIAAAELERVVGDSEAMDAVLKNAVKRCPRAVVLWLMAAKELWVRGDVPGARSVLEEAFIANPDSEDVWLAAFKLEFESRQPDRARMLLQKAREKATENGTASSERVFVKAAIVEREVGDTNAERKILKEGLNAHTSARKLWLMLGQLELRVGDVNAARDAYVKGTRRCPLSVPLWLELANLETTTGNHAKARAVLEQARLRVTGGLGSANPNANSKENSEIASTLWLASVRCERGDAFCFSAPFFGDEIERVMNKNGGTSSGHFGDRSQNANMFFDKDEAVKASEALMAKALRECPDSGLLWAEQVRSASRPQRKSRSVDALKRCGDDCNVVAAVARLFWIDRKLDKARTWFHRVCTLDPNNGDHWAVFYKFEGKNGTHEAAEAVLSRCVDAKPTKGEVWCAVRKDPKRWHNSIEQVLKKTAELVPGGEDRTAE